jgi:hypothetical protein
MREEPSGMRQGVGKTICNAENKGVAEEKITKGEINTRRVRKVKIQRS